MAALLAAATLAAMAVALVAAPGAMAQDSRFIPFSGAKQVMIPGPGCLTYPEPWEGPWTPCDAATHQASVRRARYGGERLAVDG
jgi:iron(II)-dependent oxidoreductase